MMRSNETAKRGTEIIFSLNNVVAIDPLGNPVQLIAQNLKFIIGGTSVQNRRGELPASFLLLQNYPNPFNPQTYIPFELPANCHVTLKIFDVLGKEIGTLIDESKAAGSYKVIWNGSNHDGMKMPSGLYFYSIQAGDFIDSKKMILLH